MIGPNRGVRWAAWGALGSLVLLVVAFAGYYQAERQLDAMHLARAESLALVSELRQSSDDLTRMVRTYVITGDEQYRARFEHIIAVRDGRVPRPSHPSSGWERSFDPTLAADAEDDGVALLALMEAAGFTSEELALLEQAKRSSDDLAGTEVEAMELVAGEAADQAAGQAADQAAHDADRARAIELLYGEDYLDAKAAIMAPIAQVEQSVEARYAASLDRVASTVRVWFVVLAAVGALLLAVLWELRRQLRRFHAAQQQELRERDQRLAAREALLRSLLDHSGLVVAVVDDQHHVVEADDLARRWLGVHDGPLADVEEPLADVEEDDRPVRITAPLAVEAVTMAQSGLPATFDLSATDDRRSTVARMPRGQIVSYRPKTAI